MSRPKEYSYWRLQVPETEFGTHTPPKSRFGEGRYMAGIGDEFMSEDEGIQAFTEYCMNKPDNEVRLVKAFTDRVSGREVEQLVIRYRPPTKLRRV